MYSQFTGMLLKVNVTYLKSPTGRRQTSWLFTKHERGFELRTADGEANPASGRVEALNLGPPEYLNSCLPRVPPRFLERQTLTQWFRF